MKFKKRFLMCLAIMGALLAPSIAKAGDANALHKWMTEIPDGNEMIAADGDPIAARFAPVRGAGQSIKRNQKVYMAFYNSGGDIHVNRNGEVATCTAHATTGDCVSAPLFIAGESILMCVISDVTSTSISAALSTAIRVKVCLDSSCTAVASVNNGTSLVQDAGGLSVCGEGGSVNSVVDIDQVSLGGQWIYIELLGTFFSEPDVLVWAVGK